MKQRQRLDGRRAVVDRRAERNLVDQYPERVVDFRGRIEDWKREMGMASPVIIHE